MPDVFLSYSRDDQATARKFAEAFERDGLSVWWDQALNPGEAYDEVTENALQTSRAVVVLWSKKSVASRWVRAEATQAQRNKTLIPAMIEACTRPIMFELTQTTDLSHWSGNADDKVWQSYLAAVRRFVGAADSARAAAVPDSRPHRVSGLRIAIPMALLVIAAAAWWLYGAGHIGQKTVDPVVAAPATGITLAVLPFADLSPAHDHEYFSDGLTEELLNQLARIRALRVTARTSSFSFKGRNEDLRVIGRQLGVANILEGSVRKDGKQLRITAQLIDSVNGTHLWSQTYDRELSGIFALQEEVAKDVARALRIALGVGDMPRVEGGTTDIEAYDKYLRARELYNQGGRAPALQAVQLLRDAVQLDPQFSRAWQLLVYALPETLIGVPASGAAAVRKEMAAARLRVLELAPHAWWSKALQADEFIAQRNWSQAEVAVAAARAAAAGSATNNTVEDTYAKFLLSTGRVREHVQYLERSRQSNPLSLVVSTEFQMWLAAAGQSTQAQEEYIRSKDLAGTHQRSHIFALLRLLARDNADPALIDKAFRTFIADEKTPIPLMHALAATFRNSELVRTALRNAIDDPANQDLVRMAVTALLADGFNERDLALAALRRAVIDFHSDVSIWQPFKTGLRKDPRFKEILRDMGLAEYFRTSGHWGDFCRPVGLDDFECQ